MSTTFQMPPALEEQLRVEARRRGQAPETLLYAVVQDWLHRQPLADDTIPLAQGSPEWNTLLGRIGASRTGGVIPDDATRREAFYEDDLR